MDFDIERVIKSNIGVAYIAIAGRQLPSYKRMAVHIMLGRRSLLPNFSSSLSVIVRRENKILAHWQLPWIFTELSSAWKNEGIMEAKVERLIITLGPDYCEDYDGEDMDLVLERFRDYENECLILEDSGEFNDSYNDSDFNLCVEY
ncbi:hypothetical protein J6590_061156 [Homalodisca vitripennis]|nr:hypothetical protein J6590_061156 [Homalodisca vitripennis]